MPRATRRLRERSRDSAPHAPPYSRDRVAILFEVKLIRIRGFKKWRLAQEPSRLRSIEEIAPFEAAQEIEGGDVVLIDTREPHEYQEAHLEGGKLVPPAMLADQIETAAPDKSARTIVYCRSGNRSGIATAQMQAMGYTNVASVGGGIMPGRSRGCRSSPPPA